MSKPTQKKEEVRMRRTWPQPRTISRRENTYRELNFELDGKKAWTIYIWTQTVSILLILYYNIINIILDSFMN